MHVVELKFSDISSDLLILTLEHTISRFLQRETELWHQNTDFSLAKDCLSGSTTKKGLPWGSYFMIGFFGLSFITGDSSNKL